VLEAVLPFRFFVNTGCSEAVTFNTFKQFFECGVAQSWRVLTLISALANEDIVQLNTNSTQHRKGNL
jgi:hypothetical protein